MKVTSPTIAFLFAVTLLASAQEKVFFIPSGQDAFFKSYAYTSTEYLHLKADGKYGHIDREHMFVEEDDRGVWHQDTNGTITLESELHCRNIEAEPLSIWTWHTNVVSRLPQIHDVIAAHIADSNTSVFDNKYVEERMVLIPRPEGTNVYCPISVAFPAEKITKRQLSDLLHQIETFMNAKDKNQFHVIPMIYRSRTFLLWKDHETPINRNLVRIKESIDQTTNNITPPYICFAIDRNTFEKEAHLTQEFIFHPEMTKKVRESILKETNVSNKKVEHTR